MVKVGPISQNGKSVPILCPSILRGADARGADTWQERDAAAREAAVEIDD